MRPQFPIGWCFSFLCLAVLDTVFCRSSYIRQWIPMHSESVYAGVRWVAMVTLDSKFNNIKRDGVLHAANVCGLGVLNWEILDGCTVGVIHVVAKVVGFRIHFAV